MEIGMCSDWSVGSLVAVIVAVVTALVVSGGAHG